MKPEHIKVREVGENPAAEVITDAIATVDRAEEAVMTAVTARAHQIGAETWPVRMPLVDAAENLQRPRSICGA
jgi:hypothetical protein